MHKRDANTIWKWSRTSLGAELSKISYDGLAGSACTAPVLARPRICTRARSRERSPPRLTCSLDAAGLASEHITDDDKGPRSGKACRSLHIGHEGLIQLSPCYPSSPAPWGRTSNSTSPYQGPAITWNATFASKKYVYLLTSFLPHRMAPSCRRLCGYLECHRPQVWEGAES